MGDQSARIGLGWLARIGAPVAAALLLANCAAGPTGDRVKNTNYSPRVVADGEPVPRGGGSFKLGNPYTINGRTYYPVARSGLSRRRHRLLVRHRFPRPQDRQRRSLRYERDLGRASDHADAELCARDQPRERPLHRRAGQRSRAVRPRPDHRPVDRDGQGARQLRAGAGARARRICRPRRACGQRRQRLAGDPAARDAGARAVEHPSGVDVADVPGRHPRPGATPLPPERPFALGDATVRAPTPARAAPTAPAKRARTPVSVTPGICGIGACSAAGARPFARPDERPRPLLAPLSPTRAALPALI